MTSKNATALKALLGIEDWTKVSDTLSFDSLYGAHAGTVLPFTSVSPVQAFASLGRGGFHLADATALDFSKAAFLAGHNPVGDAQKAISDAFSPSTQPPAFGHGFPHHHHHSDGSTVTGQASDASHAASVGGSGGATDVQVPVQHPVDAGQGTGAADAVSLPVNVPVQSPVAPDPVAVVPTVPGGPDPVAVVPTVPGGPDPVAGVPTVPGGPVPVGMPVSTAPTSSNPDASVPVATTPVVPGGSDAVHDGVPVAVVDALAVAGSAPAITSAAVVSGAAAAGYDPKVDTAQWHIASTFGADAQKFLQSYNGKGVHVGVYDDGIDKTNAAVMTNYDASRELVINGVKADPGVLGGGGQGIHGTATAGLIDADAAKTGGAVTGMAYGAGLTAVNVFNGAASGSGMLNAIAQMNKFDLTSNSWGWTSKWADFADVSGSFGQQLIANLTSAATTGRGGLGTVIVKSVGNDWLTDHRDANTQEFNADRHVIGIGATGQNGDVAYYSQRGSSVLVSGYSNGGGQGITTTDKTGAAGYSSGDTTNSFGGTSAAAPEVAAVVADMMGANSHLGARDVQNILAMSAKDLHSGSVFSTGKTGNMEYAEGITKTNTWNGGGYHFGNDSGFGTVDGHAAVREAEVYSWFGPAQTFNNEASLSATAAGKAVPTTSAGASFTFNVTGNLQLENVALSLNVTTKNLDNMKVVVTDPYGNKSTMLDTSTTLSGETGNSTTGHTWTLGSHAFMGEVPAGTWTATVTDTNAADGLTVNSAKLNLYGSSASTPHVFHYTDEAAKMLAYDASRLTIHDPGATGTFIDLAMTTGNAVVNLNTGSTSTMGGKSLVTIGTDTTVNKVTLGDGFSQVTANNNGDTIVGGHGSHIMTGGTGNDVLVAGWAGGTMTGGAGADTFTFNHDGFGREAVTDFKQGVDHIDLRGMGETFAGLKIVESGSTTTISGFNNSADTIVLTNMQNQHLKAGDFLFA